MIPNFILGSQVFYRSRVSETGSDDPFKTYPEQRKKVTYDEANLISSRVDDGYGGVSSYHRPVLDIDLPIAVVPSSTLGHSHLFINKELTTDQYQRLLEVLRDTGIIEHGYMKQFNILGETCVRTPHAPKGSALEKQINEEFKQSSEKEDIRKQIDVLQARLDALEDTW